MRRALLVACVGLASASACRAPAPLYRNPTASVDNRVADLLQRMTAEEKFWQLFAAAADLDPARDSVSHGLFGVQLRGADSDSLRPSAREFAEHANRVQRYFVEQTRLGIPVIFFEEALHGLTMPDATVFPQAIGLAATWDTALVGRVSRTIAAQARSRGVRQVLSPMINLATDVRWGRTEESYGEDPRLASAMTVAFIRAFEQQGVVTTPKHFVANVGDGGRDSYPININRRLMEETVFLPFEAAIREAGARSIMAAYNSVDGDPASASHFLLTEQLRTRWGFRGFVISDAGGVGGANVLHNTAAGYAEAGARALPAGLDVIFQSSISHPHLFSPAFLDGSIDPEVIDSAVARVLRIKFELGLFEQPYINVDTATAVAADPASRHLALEAARASITLLRNERSTLPLGREIKRVTVVGADAIEGRFGGYSGPGRGRVTILDGIRASLPAPNAVRYEPGVPRLDGDVVTVADSAFGPGLTGEYFDNITLAGTPRVRRTDRNVDFNWAFTPPDSALHFGWYSVRWQGTITVPLDGETSLGVAGNDGHRLYLDDQLVVDQWSKGSYHSSIAPLRLVAGRQYRLRLEYYENSGAGQIKLIWKRSREIAWRAGIASAVNSARASDATVIVAGIEEGEFRDRAMLRLPGHQEELIEAVAATGRPVVVVIVGGSAVTMSRWIDRVGAVVLAWYPGEEGGTAVSDVLFGKVNPAGRLPITFPLAEGQLPLSYWHLPTGRGDDYADLSGRPLFPFGHGLSYSRFEYSDLVLSPAHPRAGDSVVARFRITNRGSRDGDEVPQLYLRQPVAPVARPVLALAAFTRVHLAAGESREVTLVLPPARFTLLNAQLERVPAPGRFIVLVGASSADLRLRATVDFPTAGY